MKHSLWWFQIAIFGLFVSLAPLTGLAQDTPPPEVPAPAPAASETPVPVAEKKAAPKRNYRRLPLYFPLIINKQQRSEVYRIQEEYGKQIAELEAQLRALRSERDEKVMNILTPEQRQQYDDLKAKAKKSK